MKNLAIIFVLIFGSIGLNAQSIAGKWDTQKDKTILEITKSGSYYEGKILSSNNSKAKKGTLILRNVTPSGSQYKGEIYIIKKDRWVDAHLVLNGNTLEVEISPGWRTKTATWKKAN